MQIKKKTSFLPRILVLGVVICTFCASQSASALTASELPIPTQIPELEEQISVDISPEFPKPGDEVTISLSSYGTDINSAEISWQVNGSVIKTGRGAKSIKIKADALGKTSSVSVSITPTNGRMITKILNITAGTVDIIWEADTYTPPFYKGKAFFTPQENIKFVAMPHLIGSDGVLADPASVTYFWRQDDTAYADRSGFGVNSFGYKGSILMKPVVVEVEVETTSGQKDKNYLSISPTNPIVGLYEESPLLGTLWNKELSSGFEFGESEERSLLAAPYFFGAKSQADTNLLYKWSINGSQISIPLNQYGMTLRNTDKQSGLSVVGVSVENAANFLEKAEARSVINFAVPRKVFSF